MRFLYDKNAGAQTLELKNESLAHLKAQRKKTGEILRVQNLLENTAFFYEITEFSRNCALLKLQNSEILEAKKHFLRLGWAVCESAVVEKTLPFLNELGVGELVLFWGEFSQRNVKLDFARFERILASSCEQCGRNEMMKIRLCELSELRDENCVLLDFGGDDFSAYEPKNELLLVGAEGGFSQSEREKISKKIGLKSENILRAQTAIISVAAKVLA